MIQHYISNTLATNFPALETKLVHAFYDTVSRCVAMYDFGARDKEEMTIEVSGTKFELMCMLRYCSDLLNSRSLVIGVGNTEL